MTTLDQWCHSEPMRNAAPKEDGDSSVADIRATLPHIIALYNQGAMQDVLDQALSFPPSHPDAAAAYNIAGAAMVGMKRPDVALSMFDQAIRVRPDFAMAHYNRGAVLQTMGRHEDAINSFDLALGHRPDYVDAWYNRGNALRDMGREVESVASFDRALQISPEHLGALNNRGVALGRLGRLDEAIASFDRALAVKPDLSAALSQMLHLRAQICDWSVTRDQSSLGTNGERVPPLAMLAVDDDPARQLLRAKAQVSAQAPAIAFPAPTRSKRLRIGYFSADFHNHATMSLMAGLFELHDRSRFEVHTFSYGPANEDELRLRLRAGVEHFHDVGNMSDQQIAAFSRDLGIDIGVDLKGYTQGGRPEVFACRAAPLQLAYLGFPGTMGQSFIDYVIADRVVLPEEDRQFYTESVIYLPDSYQVNDNRRALTKPPSRAEQGLPQNGFVFCCFNQSYKISPAEFDIWMRLLAKTEGSVLWLLKGNEWAEINLRREAGARGIDPERLIFAERVPEAEHLARHQCAGLFLDTFKVNAHTTASDALWTGLPVVTKIGRSFAGRVAASLLHAVDLPELVTTTSEEYESLALDLASSPERLAGIKGKLEANRLTAPLFDTARFTRNIERAYEMAFERHAMGLPPGHISIAEPLVDLRGDERHGNRRS